MNAVFRFFKQLFSVPSQREQDEAYLSQATDIYDLERRMRQIDRRGYDAQRHGGTYGLFMR